MATTEDQAARDAAVMVRMPLHELVDDPEPAEREPDQAHFG